MKPQKPAFLPPGDIFTARFIERPNRFLIRCQADGFGRISAFLPNPGRLWELLLPNARLYVQRDQHAGQPGGSTRKTKYTVLAVEREGHPIFLHTHATNRVARYLIEKNLIHPLKKARIIQPEIRVGRSRFDFLLQHRGEERYLEVKSCTLFGNRVAMFPDAVTARGRKHLVELADLGRKGISTAVLFLVHYPAVKWFMPDYHTDLDFSTTLIDIRKNVQLIPAAIEWKRNLTVSNKVKILDIPWDYLHGEVKDRGSYLLLLKLSKEKTFDVGRLGRTRFRKGYYIYVGSAMERLSARIARHQRRTKKSRWHVDYLTQEAEGVTALPVRSSERLECEIAESLSLLLDKGPLKFGSSDCLCDTHLFRSETNPLNQEAFHEVLQHFRMRGP